MTPKTSTRKAAEIERLKKAHSDRGRETFVWWGISACFLLSGFAALLYQTAWLRQFSIVFGTSELAVATVLAAYMAGLGAGAAIAARYAMHITRPILAYGLLEAGIAVSALCVPILLAAAGWLHVWAIGGLAEPPDAGGLAQPAYYLFMSFMILAVPTGFMGATLPLLIRHAVHHDRQVGPRVAWLYAINTAGAVLGTVVAAFILLPSIGLQWTVYIGVAINGVVFLIAAAISRQVRQTSERAAAESENKLASSSEAALLFQKRAALILPLILLSGASAFIYEVLWTRLLNHMLGGTIYAFATMLASFLTGIAIGGLIGGRAAVNRQQAIYFFAGCQILIGLASAGIYHWVQGFAPEASGLAANAVTAMLVILPATVFIGATFPLAVRILTNDPEYTSLSTGKTYAWNTGGAIIGSILAGFFLIPTLGFEGSIRLAIAVNLLLAVAALLLVAANRKLAILVAAAASVFLVVYRPSVPLGLIDTSVIDAGRGGQSVFYKVGRSATVFLKRFEGYYYLRTNGLPEAFIEPRGAPPLRHSQKWLTALPVAARPDADSMLIVGFGGGVAVEGVPPDISDIDVIELEPAVIEANMAVSDSRRYDPLADDRVNIILNDARNALYLTDKRYDIIVSQPSHPWTAGASHLYTSEFIGLAKEHLKDDGVFVQWINSLFVDETLLRTLTATLLSQFPELRIYQPAPTILLFLASEKPLNVEQSLAATGRPLEDALLHYSYLGINSVEDLVAALAADTNAATKIAADAPINSDNYNRMAMFSRSASDGVNPEQLNKLLTDYDPLLNQDSWIYTELPDLNLEYLGSSLITSGFAQRAADLSHSGIPKSSAFAIQGLGLRHAGRRAESESALRAALEEDPTNRQARYALIRRYLGQLAQGSAPQFIENEASRLDGSARAVVDGWLHGMQRRWSDLAGLDDLLSSANPTDLWYPEAIKLRADWRIQGTNARSVNADALLILDRALMISPSTDLLVIRAGAAYRLDDPQAFVETADYVSKRMKNKLDRMVAGDYKLSERDRATMQLRVNGFLNQLESDFIAPVSMRAREVAAGFRAIGERLQ